MKKKKVKQFAAIVMMLALVTQPVIAGAEELDVSTENAAQLSNVDSEKNEEGTIEISSYLEEYQQLVDKLVMEPTEWWQFPDSQNSYVKDQFYLEWQDSSFSCKNEGASYIKLYGSSLGDSVSEVSEVLYKKGWLDYFSDDNESAYITLIKDRGYQLNLYKDKSDNITSWYLNNWPQGEDVADMLDEVRAKISQSENTGIAVDNATYSYTNGEFLSEFSVYETDGKKQAELMFWHNYGASASDEDFFFDWEEGKSEYELIGDRSKKRFRIDFTTTDTGLRIKVVCLDGVYCSWNTGQSAELWSDEEYTKE